MTVMKMSPELDVIDVCVCRLLTTVTCGMSESCGGDVPTLDSKDSRPRLRCLFLCSLLLKLPCHLLLQVDVLPGGQKTPDPPPPYQK